MSPTRTIRTHGSAGYRAGCRCEECKFAESERRRNYRAFGSGTKNVTPLRRRPTAETVGDVENAVLTQFADVLQSPTVLAAQKLAKILDDPAAIGLHVSASRELQRLLVSLRDSESSKRKTGNRIHRLGTVADMSKVRKAK